MLSRVSSGHRGPATRQPSVSCVCSSNIREETHVIVGVPKEIKNNEFRVGMTPGSVREFVSHGHTVIVEKSAGEGSSFPDEQYVAVGAEIVETAAEVFARADMIVKVKEPQPVEIEMLRSGQI